MESTDITNWPFEGVDVIHDDMVKDPNTGLYCGECHLNPKLDPFFVAKIMIRKGSEIKKGTYDMLKGFQHNTSIPHLNFYVEGEAGNMGRLVIPEVGHSFVKWIKASGKEELFDTHRKMSSLLRTMIVDISDLIQNLYDKRQITVTNLKLDNLYLAAEVTPRILVLITEAELISKDISMNELWKPLTELIGSIYKVCGYDLNEDLEARRYISFILSPNITVKSLEKYPFNWDQQTKKEYLIALIAADSGGKDGIRSSSSNAGIQWPSVHGKRPNVVDQIIEHHSYRGISYNTNVAYDYVRFIRNTYKHFDKLSHPIQAKRRTVLEVETSQRVLISK